jgi:hypothetical protein
MAPPRTRQGQDDTTRTLQEATALDSAEQRVANETGLRLFWDFLGPKLQAGATAPVAAAKRINIIHLLRLEGSGSEWWRNGQKTRGASRACSCIRLSLWLSIPVQSADAGYSVRGTECRRGRHS